MMSFDTFICYRGEVNDGISKTVAAQIYELIKDDPRFGKVFFAPEAESYNFLNHADPIISNVKKFIVVLCPDFFQDFFKNGVPDPDSATYVELYAAFKNRKCVFYPVFVNGFNWKDGVQKKVDLLKFYYQEHDVSRLHGETGVRLEAGKDFAIEHVNMLVNSLSGKQYTQIEHSALIADLDDCSNTVLNSIIPMKPESLETDYYVYLYYNSENKPFFPMLFLNNIKTLTEKCNLPEADFVYWNMDTRISPDELQHPEIDISALCFGTMIAHHWLAKDCRFHPTLRGGTAQNGLFPQDLDDEISPDHIESIRAIADGGMRLLMAMRSPLYGSWPSRWDFTKRGVEGTINQTTLSLSTLLSCDFLSNKIGMDCETFRHRQQFIHESIHWLLKAKKAYRSHHGQIVSWGYMSSKSESAVLPTAFAFDTLLKYRICLEHWLPSIREWDMEYACLLEKECTKIQDALCSAIRYFDNVKTTEGAFPLKKGTKASVTHTAKVLKSLTGYYQKTAENDKTLKSKKTAKRLIKDAFSYLLNIPPDTVLNLPDDELFETFTYMSSAIQNVRGTSKLSPISEFDKNSGEQYENCGELLYVVALSDAVSLDFLNTPSLKDKVRQNISYVFSNFRNRYVKGEDIKFIIQGKRTKGPLYPIYYLYYYRMAIYHMLRNLDPTG